MGSPSGLTGIQMGVSVVQFKLKFRQLYLHEPKHHHHRQCDGAMDDWNEPRLVLAVLRAGSLTGAAKSLGIDHSTAFRRLNALEDKLGVRLFERIHGGAYTPTSAGERMAAAAERMED